MKVSDSLLFYLSFLVCNYYFFFFGVGGRDIFIKFKNSTSSIRERKKQKLNENLNEI